MRHLPETVASERIRFPIVSRPPAERRDRQRLRTVYRVERVTANRDQGPAKVQNLSDEGLMLSLALPACPGTDIAIELSEGCNLQGTIVWRNGGHCGVKLGVPNDSGQTLKRLYHISHAGMYRPCDFRSEKPSRSPGRMGHSSLGYATSLNRE